MKSFSFLEVIISVAIGSIAFLAIFSLASQNFNAANLTKMRFVAAHLAQEGIEVVANIRSNNWLKYPDDLNPDNTFRKWRGETSPPCFQGDLDCLADGSNYIAQYDSLKLFVASGQTDQKLGIDSDSRYCHTVIGCVGTTSSSPYSRVISIFTEGDHQMRLISTVSWDYNNKGYIVNLEERLYNWK